MAKQVFTLNDGSGQEVEIAWRGMWKDINVTLDGRAIGTFEGFGDLKKGKIFKTPKGDLLIEFKQGAFTSGMEASLNGEALGGAANDPETQWRSGFQMAMFLGVLNLALGAATLLLRIDFLRSIGIGEYSIVIGGVMFALGYWAWKRQSAVALGLAALIFGGDAVLGFLLTAAGGSASFGGIIARVFLLIPMIRGVSGARAMNERKSK